MKRTMGGAALLAATMAIAPLQANAQMGPRGARGQAVAPRGPGIEMILRQREQLELTDNQVKELDQLRQEAVQRRTAHQSVVAELRSKVRAGEMEVSEFREQVQAMRDGAEEVRNQQDEKVQSVLTDDQKAKLDEWAGQARAFRAGRMSAQRGGARAPRGQRSFRGGPGQGGFGYGAGPGWGDGCPAAGPGAQGRANFRRGPGARQGIGPWEELPPR